MVTPKISPVEHTVRKYVRAHLRLAQAPLRSDLQRRADQHLRSLFHWSTDALEEDGCTCEAHLWWAEQVRIHRGRRSRE